MMYDGKLKTKHLHPHALQLVVGHVPLLEKVFKLQSEIQVKVFPQTKYLNLVAAKSHAFASPG